MEIMLSIGASYVSPRQFLDRDHLVALKTRTMYDPRENRIIKERSIRFYKMDRNVNIFFSTTTWYIFHRPIPCWSFSFTLLLGTLPSPTIFQFYKN